MRLKLALSGPEKRTVDLGQEGGRPIVRFPMDVQVVNDGHGWVERFRIGFVVPWDQDDLPLTLRSKIALREGTGAKHLPADLSLGPFDVVPYPFAVWYPRYTRAGTLLAVVYLTDGEFVRWHRMKLDYQCNNDVTGIVTTVLAEAEAGKLPVSFVER